MKKLSSVVAILVSVVGIHQVYNLPAHAHNESCNMIPRNNLKYPVNLKAGHMSQASFVEILRKVKNALPRMPKPTGDVEVLVKANWEDSTVNAYARINVIQTPSGQDVKQREVMMFGGLARHPLVTPDAFALVLCHELGHHFGGHPLYFGRAMSAEGQSDYWATLKCFRHAFGGDNNVEIVKRMTVSQPVRQKCQSVYPNAQQAALCMRATMAGLSLAKTLGSLANDDQVGFQFAWKPAGNDIYPSHPEAQCRLETMFRGALCTASANEPTSMTSSTKGVCRAESAAEFGKRAACWYNPKSGDLASNK